MRAGVTVRSSGQQAKKSPDRNSGCRPTVSLIISARFLCNATCRPAGGTLGGRDLRIVRILRIRNLRDLDSSADHVLAAVVASGFCGKIGLFHEFISGTHQAFASTPIVEDASTWCRRTQPIPGDAILLAKLLGAIHDRCVINFCHPHAPCLRQAYWIEAQGAIIGSRAVTLKFSNIGILQLLERLTIALFVVFLVAALVLVIKYDIERTAAPQPATRTGMNSAPIRGAQS